MTSTEPALSTAATTEPNFAFLIDSQFEPSSAAPMVDDRSEVPHAERIDRRRKGRINDRSQESPVEEWTSSIPTVESAGTPSTRAASSWPGVEPPVPLSRAPHGLPIELLQELIAKWLYPYRPTAIAELAGQLRLPFGQVAPVVTRMIDQRLVEVASGESVQLAAIISLTETGRLAAKRWLEHDRYVGPAPVPWNQYLRQSARQSPFQEAPALQSPHIDRDSLYFPEAFWDELGPTLHGARALALWGDSGNGKSSIARAAAQALRRSGGWIYLPYAVYVRNAIVTVYDPAIHSATDDADLVQLGLTNRADDPLALADPVVRSKFDLRWRRIERPVLTLRAESSAAALSVQGHPPRVPWTIAAAGGTLIVEDVLHSRARRSFLTDRLSIPLSEFCDRLMMPDGSPHDWPLQAFIILTADRHPSTWLPPTLLRRLLHSVFVPPPTPEALLQILLQECVEANVEIHRDAVDWLGERWKETPALGSDPADLVNLAVSIGRFRKEDSGLSLQLVQSAWSRLSQGRRAPAA